MVGNVVTQNLPAPELDRAEVLRYAGCKADYKTDFPEKCMEVIGNDLRYSVCWAEYPVVMTDDGVDFGFTKITSQYARRMLLGCDSALVFAATVGLAPDRMIAKFGKLSPVASLMFQALGTERVESLCNSFCKARENILSDMGCRLGVRFSPGYGDIPLSMQLDLFNALDVTHNIGVSLTDALMMVPTKSVTAIAGIGTGGVGISSCSSGCDHCSKEGCGFRKG